MSFEEEEKNRRKRILPFRSKTYFHFSIVPQWANYPQQKWFRQCRYVYIPDNHIPPQKPLGSAFPSHSSPGLPMCIKLVFCSFHHLHCGVRFGTSQWNQKLLCSFHQARERAEAEESRLQLCSHSLPPSLLYCTFLSTGRTPWLAELPIWRLEVQIVQKPAATSNNVTTIVCMIAIHPVSVNTWHSQKINISQMLNFVFINSSATPTYVKMECFYSL